MAFTFARKNCLCLRLNGFNYQISHYKASSEINMKAKYIKRCSNGTIAYFMIVYHRDELAPY